MKKIEVGQVVQIVANVGVIASIVILALQLRQSNELMATTIDAAQLAGVTAMWTTLVEQPELAELLYRDGQGEPLTPAEDIRLNAVWMRVLSYRQFSFEHMHDDFASAQPGLRRAWQRYASLRKTWSGSGQSAISGRDNFHPEFARFMDENAFQP